MTGASASVSLVSWRSRMSGAALVSQFSTASWRALSELTFQVAIRMVDVRLVTPAALPVEIEGRGVGNGHDGHRPGLDRVRDDQIDVVGDRADHVQRDDRDADGTQLLGRHTDVAAHDRPRQHEQPGTWQVGDGADGGRDVVLPDQWDRVDADPLATEVVPVGLADRAERDLRDLRPTTDDDDPLAEDPIERACQMDGTDVDERFEGRRERVLRDALDLQLDLSERRVALDAAHGGQGPDPTAECGHGIRHAGQRPGGVDDVEPDRRGLDRSAPRPPPT